jgi:hypothetical protein
MSYYKESYKYIMRHIYIDQYNDFVIFGMINCSKIIKHDICAKLKPSIKIEDVLMQLEFVDDKLK